MARGWESKNIEEQMSIQATAPAKENQTLTPEQVKARQEKASLELMRAKIQGDLRNNRSPQHAAMMESALKDIEKKLTGK